MSEKPEVGDSWVRTNGRTGGRVVRVVGTFMRHGWPFVKWTWGSQGKSDVACEEYFLEHYVPHGTRSGRAESIAGTPANSDDPSGSLDGSTVAEDGGGSENTRE